MKFLVVLVALTSQHFAYGSWKYPETDKEWIGVCITGKTQSPVDIAATAIKKSNDVFQFNYASNGTIGSWKTVNNGHTVQISPDGTNKWNHEVVAANKTYSLAQLHFHRKSEHTMDKKRYDMEIHMVHADGTNNLVVGLLVSQTAKADADKTMQTFIDNIRTRGIPAKDKEIIVTDCKTKGDCIDLYAVLGKTDIERGSFINYNGSLTTPPCSEPVKWYVAKKIFKADLTGFVVYTGDNYRQTQNAKNTKLTLLEVQSSSPTTTTTPSTSSSTTTTTTSSKSSSSSVVRGSFILTLICLVAHKLQF